MTLTARLPIKALASVLATLTLAATLAVAVPPRVELPGALSALDVAAADAHTAYKTVTKYRQHCWMRDYWQRMPGPSWELRQREFCVRLPYEARVSRRHIHISKSVCRTVVGTPVTAATSTAGGIIGTGGGGPGAGTVVGAAVGASVGVGATYTVCELVPNVIWFG